MITESGGGNWLPLVIEIIPAVIAMISAIISCCTLREMKKERDMAYKPVICFSNPIYTVACTKDIITSKLFLGQIEDRKRVEMYDMGSEFVNIGAGAAKDIRFIWSEKDVDKLVQLLNPNTMVKENGAYKISFESQECFISSSVLRDGTDYLLPDHKEKRKIRIPIVFGYLVSALMKQYCEDEYKYSDLITKIPTLSLQVEFSDIQGKRYCQTEEVNFHIIAAYLKEKTVSFELSFRKEVEEQGMVRKKKNRNTQKCSL